VAASSVRAMNPSFVHRLDQFEAWQRDTIRTHGWALQAVLGDAEGPPFVYTVGLSGFGHPELIVFAVGHATAARLLNRLGEYVRRGGRLGPGDTVGLPEGLVSVLELPDPEVWLLGAQRLYRIPGGPPVAALLVLPEEGYAESAEPDQSCALCE